MNGRREALLICVLVAIAPGCVTHEDALRSVKARASFDLDCPPGQIDVEILPSSPRGRVFGAKGCGKRSAYEVGEGNRVAKECVATPGGEAGTKKDDVR